MALRVTASEVKEIMDGCTVVDSIVETFILAANALINKVFAGDTIMGTVLLKEIERWFTAHMLASTLVRMASKEKLGDAEITYTGKYAANLDSTPYGQMVKQLDITGKMSQYVGKQMASLRAVKSFSSKNSWT